MGVLADASERAPRVPSWLRPFSRVTSGRGYMPSIDGLRFFAIVSVIAWHVYLDVYKTFGLPESSGPGAFASNLMRIGPIGVELFFVISGFILAIPFAHQHLSGTRPVSLRKYFLRRLTRLEPPYVLALLVFFTLKTILLGEKGLFPHFVASVFYLHNIVYGGPSEINGVAWSLEIEVQFYLLAPLIALVFRIPSRSFRRSVIAATMLILGIAFPTPSTEPVKYLLPYLNYFLVGMLLADIYLNEWQRGSALSNHILWDVVATIGWLALAFSLFPSPPTSIVTPLIIFSIYAGTLNGIVWRWITSQPIIFVIGGMCYTMYLYHNLVVQALIRRLDLDRHAHLLFGDDWMVPALAIMLLPFVIVVCCVPFVIVERPFMRKKISFAFVDRFRTRQPGPRDRS